MSQIIDRAGIEQYPVCTWTICLLVQTLAVKSSKWRAKDKEKENHNVSYTIWNEWLATQNVKL